MIAKMACTTAAVTRRQAGNDRLVADLESVVYALVPSVSLDAGIAELVKGRLKAAPTTAIPVSKLP